MKVYLTWARYHFLKTNLRKLLHFLIPAVHVCGSSDRVSYSSGWTFNFCETDNDRELLVLLPPWLQCCIAGISHHANSLAMLFLFLFVCACASVSTHICVGVCAYEGQRPNSSVSHWALSATRMWAFWFLARPLYWDIAPCHCVRLFNWALELELRSSCF